MHQSRWGRVPILRNVRVSGKSSQALKMWQKYTKAVLGREWDLNWIKNGAVQGIAAVFEETMENDIFSGGGIVDKPDVASGD